MSKAKIKPVKKEIKRLCETDEQGNVHKSLITVENYEQLQAIANTLDIEVLKTSKGFSYRQYCKLLESYIFKSKKCDDKVCCQAITESGKRCSRASSKFVTIDITEVQITPSIPQFLKTRLGAKKIEALKLLGFANSCCFYCWQHASMFASEKITWSTNLVYYTTHPEDLLSIFFDNVVPVKFFGTVTYTLKSLGELRTPDEIIKYMYKTHATANHGPLSSVYWGIFITAFMYDKIKAVIMSFLSGDNTKKEEIIEQMAENAAETILNINNQ